MGLLESGVRKLLTGEPDKSSATGHFLSGTSPGIAAFSLENSSDLSENPLFSAVSELAGTAGLLYNIQ